VCESRGRLCLLCFGSDGCRERVWEIEGERRRRGQESSVRSWWKDQPDYLQLSILCLISNVEVGSGKRALSRGFAEKSEFEMILFSRVTFLPLAFVQHLSIISLILASLSIAVFCRSPNLVCDAARSSPLCFYLDQSHSGSNFLSLPSLTSEWNIADSTPLHRTATNKSSAALLSSSSLFLSLPHICQVALSNSIALTTQLGMSESPLTPLSDSSSPLQSNKMNQQDQDENSFESIYDGLDDLDPVGVGSYEGSRENTRESKEESRDEEERGKEEGEMSDTSENRRGGDEEDQEIPVITRYEDSRDKEKEGETVSSILCVETRIS